MDRIETLLWQASDRDLRDLAICLAHDIAHGTRQAQEWVSRRLARLADEEARLRTAT